MRKKINSIYITVWDNFAPAALEIKNLISISPKSNSLCSNHVHVNQEKHLLHKQTFWVSLKIGAGDASALLTAFFNSSCFIICTPPPPPIFFKKSWDFHTKRSVGKGNDCMLSITFYLTYFLRNVAFCSNFYFWKSTSKNTQYSDLWDTLGMMLFTKY